MRRPFVGGNWKMNTNAASGRALAAAVADGLARDPAAAGADVAIFPPFLYLREIRAELAAKKSPVLVGAQDVYFESDGAFTGEISVAMLKDSGIQVVLAGHSERRHVLGEPDAVINKKTRAVLAGGLQCILCVGEKLEERERGETDRINDRQLRAGLAGVAAAEMSRLTIAYEPVWAIGTGKTATPQDAQDAHHKIRGVISDLYGPQVAAAVRIQYGGSVKASNAAELMAQPDIDGGLIGGASLKADEFLAIVRAAAQKNR